MPILEVTIIEAHDSACLSQPHHDVLGGLYLGLTPLSDFQSLNAFYPSQTWLFNAFLGVVIGDGVGAGFELTELLLGPATPTEPAPISERPDRWEL